MAAAEVAARATMKVVAQRVSKASLLVDNVSRYASIGDGVVLHVAFLKGAGPEVVSDALKTLLNSQIFILSPLGTARHTRGEIALGTDGTAATRPQPVAIVDAACDVLVVPQATMAGKVNGKKMQYHGQAPKDEGAALYNLFVTNLRQHLNVTHGESSGRDANGAVDVAMLTDDVERLVVAGTYGNRQALEFSSPGPFTHFFEF